MVFFISFCHVIIGIKLEQALVNTLEQFIATIGFSQITGIEVLYERG